MVKLKSLAWLVVCTLILSVEARVPNSSAKDAVNVKNNQQLLRQSQNTFIQWVLSLLPPAPTVGFSTTLTITPSTQAITSTTPSILTTIPSSSPSPSPAISSIKPTQPSTTSTAAPISTTVSTTSSTAAPPSTPAPTKAPSSILNPPRNCSDCFCGIANIQKRIVGGQETEVNQYPWMAMLLYGGRFYCAGSLINDQYLISASHCVYGFRKERITVRLLEHNRKMSNFQKIDRNIAEIVTHPKYNARTYDNDIAVIKLDQPVEFSDLLHPVCLPTPGKSFKGETGIVTGWGALKVGGSTSDTLQEVQVPIMSQEQCRKSRYGASRITDNMLCAGYDEGKKDSCQGDSGGPLHIVASGSREHQIAGVVSWGEGCAKAGYPGVYARVNRYGTWIRTLSKNACLCHSETKKIKK